MHTCKLEDHLSNICSKIVLPCINSIYGCNRRLRRYNLGLHLKKCPASLVVCSREWNRQVLSTESKSEMKKLSKSYVALQELKGEMEKLDLQFARSDQNLVMDSYKYSRVHRNSQRTEIHPAHPLLPLRKVFKKSASPVFVIPDDDAVDDSSDEENRAKHLHTLGNPDSNFKKFKMVKRYPKKVNEVLKQCNLMIDSEVECIPEIPKGENIRKIANGGTIYTRRCLRVFRRDEYADHQRSQHENTLNSLSELVVRCPNWSRGCTFTCSRLKPKKGKIRFSNYLDAFVSTSDTVLHPTTPALHHLMNALPTIVQYLPSSSIRSLSQTCRSFRANILENCENRGMIEVIWKKLDGVGWVEAGTKCSFSIADHAIEMEWKPANELCEHLSECPYRDTYTFRKERVNVLIREHFETTENVLQKYFRESYELIADDLNALRPPDLSSEEY
ncbi:unnamed protein product [Auanema sp. JU1783]|nr:unnamed protein product [Auanema sp. JU1783]